MKPKFTDEYKYPRGYVRSEATDIAKTWAAARKRITQDVKQSDGNVRKLIRLAGART
jgi:hypothetical protein